MKQSTLFYFFSLVSIATAVLNAVAASPDYGTSYIAACVFWCSGCIIEMLEKRQ